VVAAANGLKGRLEAIWQKIRREAIQRADESDPILYHYTTPDGLIGILKRRRLWATSVRHFEDRSELLYAEGIFEQVLNGIAARHSPSSLQGRLAEACRIEPNPPPHRSPLTKGSGGRAIWLKELLERYVACFSTRNDSIDQWKKYAGRGAGFAIGFDRHKLHEAIQPSTSGAGPTAANVNLAKVRYSVDSQKHELRDIFDQCCNAISAASPPADVDLCAGEIVKALALHAALFKDPKLWRGARTFASEARQIWSFPT